MWETRGGGAYKTSENFSIPSLPSTTGRRRLSVPYLGGASAEKNTPAQPSQQFFSLVSHMWPVISQKNRAEEKKKIEQEILDHSKPTKKREKGGSGVLLGKPCNFSSPANWGESFFPAPIFPLFFFLSPSKYLGDLAPRSRCPTAPPPRLSPPYSIWQKQGLDRIDSGGSSNVVPTPAHVLFPIFLLPG